MTGRGLLQAYLLLLSLALAAAAVFVDGPAASWAVPSVLTATALILSLRADRARKAEATARNEDSAKAARADPDPRVSGGQLVQELESSRSLPLFRNQLRVNKLAVYELVGQIRDAASAGEAEMNWPGAATPTLLDAAEAVEHAVHHAVQVPLTDDVRLPQERVTGLVHGLRAAGA